MINKSISEYNVSITYFNEVIGQNENSENKCLVDECAIIGYDKNLKSWYLNAFSFDKNKYKLSLPVNGNKFQNVLFLLENLKQDKGCNYVINNKDLDNLIEENIKLKLKGISNKISPYCYGNNKKGNSDLIKLLERKLEAHIALSNVKINIDKTDPGISYDNNDNIIYKSIKDKINFLNAQISFWGWRLAHLTEQERIEIAQTYTDFFELKNKEHSHEIKLLSSFYQQWYEDLIN